MQHHPCTESHTAEVVFLGEMTGDNSTYPTDDQVRPVRGDELPAGVHVVHRPRRRDGDRADDGYYRPDQGRLGQGRAASEICYVYRVDNQPMTQSVKAAAQ